MGRIVTWLTQNTTHSSSPSDSSWPYTNAPLLGVLQCKLCLFWKALNAIMIQLRFVLPVFLLPEFLLHVLKMIEQVTCATTCVPCHSDVLFPGITRSVLLCTLCAWWPHCWRQVVALSWELPACCACALVRESSRQTTVLCWSQTQFPLLQYLVAQNES